MAMDTKEKQRPAKRRNIQKELNKETGSNEQPSTNMFFSVFGGIWNIGSHIWHRNHFNTCIWWLRKMRNNVSH